jgi:hypothetical protein
MDEPRFPAPTESPAPAFQRDIRRRLQFASTLHFKLHHPLTNANSGVYLQISGIAVGGHSNVLLTSIFDCSVCAPKRTEFKLSRL